MLVIHSPKRWFLLQHRALLYCIVCGVSVRMREDVKQTEGTKGGLNPAEVTPSSTLPLTHN